MTETTWNSLQKERIECNLVVVRDGEQAIAYLREANAGKALSPDLIFLDIKMPRVTGLEVLEWIQANSEHDQVVVVLTASPLKNDIERAYELGANGYLCKPSEVVVLRSMLKAACDFWLKYNLSPRKTTSECPTEGVVSLDRLGRAREVLFPSPCWF